MLDMDEVTEALSNPAYESESPKGEQEMQGESGGHASMMCEVIMRMGRLEAKLDQLLDYEIKEESDESSETRATDGILALPSSPAPDTYLPMDFMTMGA